MAENLNDNLDSRQPVSRAARLAIVVSTALLAGCGDGNPPRADVEGVVLLDGQPLRQGDVLFVPEGGRPSVAQIQEDGRFTLSCFGEDDGALLGTHRVAISAKKMHSESNVEWFAPPRYSDYKTSGLTIEVTEDTEDVVIELTSKDS